MVEEIKVRKYPIYKCPECGLTYSDEELAKKCEAWCREHKSCNLEIVQYSLEAKKDNLN